MSFIMKAKIDSPCSLVDRLNENREITVTDAGGEFGGGPRQWATQMFPSGRYGRLVTNI